MSVQGEAVQTAQSMSKLAFLVNDTSQHLCKAMPSVTCMSVSTSVPVQAPVRLRMFAQTAANVTLVFRHIPKPVTACHEVALVHRSLGLDPKP